MCECKNTKNAGGKTFGVLFETNAQPIAQVFCKYGYSNMPVTPEAAASIANTLGEQSPAFATDLGNAMYTGISHVDGGKSPAEIAALALTLLGTTSVGVGSFLQGLNTPPAQTAGAIAQGGGAAAPASTEPNAPKPDEKQGLSTWHLALLGGLAIAALGLFIYAVTKK